MGGTSLGRGSLLCFTGHLILLLRLCGIGTFAGSGIGAQRDTAGYLGCVCKQNVLMHLWE